MNRDVRVPTTQEELDALEARYRPFVPVDDWVALPFAADRWQRHRDALAVAVAAAGPERWEAVREQFRRAAAMDSTVLAQLARPMSDVTTVVLSQSVEADAWDAVVAASTVVVECHRRALVVADDVAASERVIDEQTIAQLQDLIVESQQSYTVTVEDGTKREVELPRRQYKPVSNYLMRPDHDLAPFAPAPRVAGEMARLASDLAGLTFAQLHPVVQAAFLHASLTRIHPFADGNGRLARTVAAIPLLRATGLPLLVLVDQWPAYVEALNRADQDDFMPLLDLVTAAQVNALDLARMLLESPAGQEAHHAPELRDSPQRMLRDLVTVHARAAASALRRDVAVTTAGAGDDALRLVVAAQNDKECKELLVEVTADAEDARWLWVRAGGDCLEVWHDDVWPAPVELTHLRVRAWVDRLLVSGGSAPPAEQTQRARGIFVLGSPRSGTTLLGNYLSSHPDVLGLAEYGGFYVAHSVGPAYLQRLPGLAHDRFTAAVRAAAVETAEAQARDASCRWYCDATPWNLEVAPALAAQLPDAVFVLMLRHFAGAVLSLSQFGWAGGSWEQVAALWVSLNAGAGSDLPGERTVVVSYDELAAHPVETIGAVDEVATSLGLAADGLDKKQLARSHAAVIDRPRPTIATVVDDDEIVFTPIDSLDEDRWTPDVHSAVWPVVADVHRALAQRFPGAYVSPPRPAHVPVAEW